MPFIQHQHQIFGRGQHRFALHRRHHQRVVGDHHFRFLDLPTRNKEGALAVVVAVSVQAARFIGAQASPEIVADGFIGVIAQAIPLVAVEIGFQRCAARLLLFVAGRQFVIEKGQQILLIGIAAGERGKIARADIAPAAKGGGKA